MALDTALELSLYLSRETEIMAVTQGFGELVPLYKLMEKRDMTVLENQMKVRKGSMFHVGCFSKVTRFHQCLCRLKVGTEPRALKTFYTDCMCFSGLHCGSVPGTD